MLKKLKKIETIKNEYLDKGFKVKETASGCISFYDAKNFHGVIIESMYFLFDTYIKVEKIDQNKSKSEGYINSIEKDYDYFCCKENTNTYKWYFKNEWFENDDILPDNLFEI